LKKLKKKLLKKLISEAKNNKVVKAVEKIKKAGVKILRNDEWQIEDNCQAWFTLGWKSAEWTWR